MSTEINTVQFSGIIFAVMRQRINEFKNCGCRSKWSQLAWNFFKWNI